MLAADLNMGRLWAASRMQRSGHRMAVAGVSQRSNATSSPSSISYRK